MRGLKRSGEWGIDWIRKLGRAFEELLIVDDKGEIVGRGEKLWERYPCPEAVRAHRELFERGESSFEFEERGRHYLFKGKRVGELGVFIREEITLKKEVEELKREVFSTLSHQIKTPLTVIRGNAEMSLEFGAEKEELEEIVKKCSEIEEILKGLQKLFERSGRFPLINLRPVALECVREFERRAREKGLEFKHSLKDVNLPAEPTLFKQLLINLLDNAVKFTERGRVEVELTEGYLKVSDTGCGIDEEIRERLFEKFVKGKRSNGEGIGLSVVKEIARFHGWRVDVESNKGEGATFTVYF